MAKSAWEVLLDEIDEFLEEQEDVRDGSDGPRPNRAMQLLTDLRHLRPAARSSGAATFGLCQKGSKETGLYCRYGKDACTPYCALPDAQRPTARPDPCDALCRECRVSGKCIKTDPVYQNFARADQA